MKNNVIVKCQLKKVYPTKEVADKTGIYLFLEKGIEVYSYHCNVCSNYHLSRKK